MRVKVIANGLRLPYGDNFEAPHCQPSRYFDRNSALDLIIEPKFLLDAIRCRAFIKSIRCRYFFLSF